MKIKVLAQLKNYTLIKDELTGIIWLYSYGEPIANFENGKLYVRENLTNMSSMHFSWFKKFIDKLVS
jgi:hypothetical protein